MMEDTFTQIEGAAQYSIPEVNVSITNEGSIMGQGVMSNATAVEKCGGKIDDILRSFGGVEGGNMSFGGKNELVATKLGGYGEKLSTQLEKKLKHVHEQASDLETLSSLAKGALSSVGDHEEVHKVLSKIISHVDQAARDIRGAVDKEIKPSKESVDDFVKRNQGFVNAIKSLGARLDTASKAGMLSLTFSSVNQLKKLGKDVSQALKVVDMKKNDYLGSTLSQLDSKLSSKLAGHGKKMSSDDMKKFIEAWSVLMQHYGHRSQIKDVIGGYSKTDNLSERLLTSRQQLRDMINKFIDAFGINVNGIASSANKLAADLGKSIEYDDNTILFLDSFKRLNQYLDSKKSKLYQHLLELNADQVDSKEIKDRFIASFSELASRAASLSSTPSSKELAQHCNDVIDTINKFSDMIKSHRDEFKKEGGSTDSMNELFSIDSSKIDITGLLNPLQSLEIAVKKIEFFRNIAVFRSNLKQTSHELAVYSKDYTKSVGQAIGEAITKIQSEYNDVINQISDNKAGMGLEIDMYNDSADSKNKISKEKLKMIYKWQCDARIGLYKTVEAIDLYLLHFTESVVKNPDAVADLHKMLSATRIIAKWYDNTAGDNLIRAFESFGDVTDEVLDKNDFVSSVYQNENAYAYADLQGKLGGDKAMRVYERCRRAVQGVVVLKNIISYFITISEKYGDFKSERNIYMAPNNIYKNLTNYIWVSALDVNTTGTEVLTDNNETKRLLTYEDTKVKFAQKTNIDPETLGINFNKHSIDKLRILKCMNEIQHLKNTVGFMGDEDIIRVKQFVISVFARLGKTKYIFEMFKYGVFDLSQMNDDMLKSFIEYIVGLFNGADRRNKFIVIDGQQYELRDEAQRRAATDGIKQIPLAQRNERVSFRFMLSNVREDLGSEGVCVSLDQFKIMKIADLYTLLGSNTNLRIEGVYVPAARGFLRGFLRGLDNNESTADSTAYGQRTVIVLQTLISEMLNKYNKDNSSSVFAIDDTYFILTVKAIAGKIMAVTGINKMFKNPDSYKNTILTNQTRLIMGGAYEDNEIIEDAVELYVRLPLLVEFYRRIFDNGNDTFKHETTGTSPADEETISFVPEVGGVWSGLIMNIFDKARYIKNGVYTMDNMKKIVSEVNSIYKHYKNSVDDKMLTRHVMTELAAEINRRYGIIKREELARYYRVVNTTTRNRIEVGESNYINNDLDILNEANEFEEKSPSDEFIKYKATLADPNVSIETKINKLTDYKILKTFRESIANELSKGEQLVQQQDGRVTMVDRIRLLKKVIREKQTKEEKYDMIIKAIEEAEMMNHASNDIYACFHEFVVMPLRTAYQMHYAIDSFLSVVYTLSVPLMKEFDGELTEYLKSEISIDGTNEKVVEAINKFVLSNRNTAIVVKDQDKNHVLTGQGNKVGTLWNDMKFSSSVADDAQQDPANGSDGYLQSLIIRAFAQFTTNAGDLVKIKVSTTNNITLDFSEYQKVCEYLVANVKFMIDKFTGVIPEMIIEKARKIMNGEGVEVDGGVYTLEKKLIHGIFNKLNKREKERDIVSVDTLNGIMPFISKTLFEKTTMKQVFTRLLLEYNSESQYTSMSKVMPVIRDCFKEYDANSRAFVSRPNTAFAQVGRVNQIVEGTETRFVSKLLFNPVNGAQLDAQSVNSHGILQEFNTLIACYLNDLYDSQSGKIYTKAFSTFSGSALINALNGQSIADFTNVSGVREQRDLGAMVNSVLYNIPTSQTVLSSTLSYVIRTLSNRTNPVSGMKVHEVANMQDLSPHIMERYRALIPMYRRIFKAFITRCQLLRKLIGRIKDSNQDTVIGNVQQIVGDGPLVKDNKNDSDYMFTNQTETLMSNAPAPANANDSVNATIETTVLKDSIGLYIDEIVNAMGSLIQDVEFMQQELLETDPTVSLYFDIKKDFTKTFMMSSKQLPFAPISILAMGFLNQSGDNIRPIYSKSDNTSNKFLYGMRSLLMNDFQISSKNIPYLKKLVDEYNGYNTNSNNISEKKYNDVLEYVAKATNFIYDFRFFNGAAYMKFDLMTNHKVGAAEMTTFQERNSKAVSLSLIENVNFDESKIKIAQYVGNTGEVRANAQLQLGQNETNARTRAIMVNLVDMNIMPINIHSLMREIPLANLYNYAMTFDSIVDSLSANAETKNILKNPYLTIGENVPRGDYFGQSEIRFVNDQLISKVLRGNNAGMSNEQKSQRYNSKLFRNLLFLTLVQQAIKVKVKSELDFINTRIVENTTAVSDVITDLKVNGVGQDGIVDDDIFQF